MTYTLADVHDYSQYLSEGLLGATTPRSPHWEDVRLACVARHPFCAACGGTLFLQAHHMKPYHLFPELELADGTGKWSQAKSSITGMFIDNIIILCEHPNRLCHLRDGHCWDWKAYNPDVVAIADSHLRQVRARQYERGAA